MRKVMSLPKGTHFTSNTIAEMLGTDTIASNVIGLYIAGYDKIYVKKVKKTPHGRGSCWEWEKIV